jgi:hypothetical protein
MKQSRQSRSLVLYEIALVSAVAFTLLLSRNSETNTAQAQSSHETTVQYQFAHPKRQTLDQDGGFEFNLTTQASFIAPPSAPFLRRSCSDEPLLLFQPNSYYHNRPPPLS